MNIAATQVFADRDATCFPRDSSFFARSPASIGVDAYACVMFCSRSGAVTPVPPLSVADLTLTEPSSVQLNIIPEESASTWAGDLLVFLAFQQVKSYGIV